MSLAASLQPAAIRRLSGAGAAMLDGRATMIIITMTIPSGDASG